MKETNVIVECPHCVETAMMPAYTASKRFIPDPEDDAKEIDSKDSSEVSIVVKCKDCGEEIHHFAGACEFDHAGELIVRGEPVKVIRGFKNQHEIIRAMSDYILMQMKQQNGARIASETSESVRHSISNMNQAIHSETVHAEPSKPRDTSMILADLKAGRITQDEARRLFRDGDDDSKLLAGAVSRNKAIERGENPYDGLIIDGLNDFDEEPKSVVTISPNAGKQGTK